MSRPIPPLYDPIVDDGNGTTKSWQSYFANLFSGDTGTSTWKPSFTGLTTVGTPTYESIYYRINGSLVYFRVVINPATSTTSVAGTTYIDNFPLDITSDGACIIATNGTAATGMVNASNKRIYMPAWSAITTKITISGTIEAR